MTPLLAYLNIISRHYSCVYILNDVIISIFFAKTSGL